MSRFTVSPMHLNIERTLALGAPSPGVSAILTQLYLGGGLRRVETQAFETSDDYVENVAQRFSEDNGRQWSPWRPIVKDWPRQGDCTKQEWPCCVVFDP